MGDTVLLLRRGSEGFGEGLAAQSVFHVVGYLPGECAEVGKVGEGGINPEHRLCDTPWHPSPTQCPLPSR